MAKTFGDTVAVTASGTADAKSAAATITISPSATIVEITVLSLTVGNIYAVELVAPKLEAPQRYVIPSNAAVLANGGKIQPSKRIKCNIEVPAGLSQISVYVYADVASATGYVGLKWVA